MTTESEKYEGYKWIKIPRSQPCEFDGQKYVSEDHHIQETSFLIEEVRSLAKRIDELKASLSRCRKQQEVQRRQARRQAQWESDYLPYHEDDRD